MHLINLHAHSRFSDGRDSMVVMANTCKQLGHCACVITDHVYSLRDDGSSGPYDMTPLKFELAITEAKAITELSDFPVIVGIELSIRGFEEVVVIGEEAIKEIFAIRHENKQITIQDLTKVREKHKCLVNWCHPMNVERFIEAGGHLILDAYEFIHCGQFMFPRKNSEPVTDPAEFGITRICNSDAHNEKTLMRCCNIFEEPVRTEIELINYIKEKKSVKHHIEPLSPYN